MSDKRPNIIVISADQQRYDSLGIHGNAHVPTPHLQALADSGTLFTHAYIQNPVCVPSRACMHTGRYIHQHGCDHMSESHMPALPPWEITFMEHLQGAGYETGAVGKIHMVETKGYDWTRLTGGKSARWRQRVEPAIGPAGIGPVYEQWVEEHEKGAFEKIFTQRQRDEYVSQRKALPFPLSNELYIETWIRENAVEFIRKEREQPFFLWVGFCGPHTPYDPPEPYASMYNIDDVPLPPHFGTVPKGRPDFLKPGRQIIERNPEIERTARRVVAYYWALNRCIDDRIGEIINELESRNELDNTLIIYTTDHGDHIWEWDGMWGKGDFYETIIRAPFIVKPPVLNSNKVPQFDGLVETFDLAATCLDYAGIEKPLEMEAESLRPIIESGKGGKESILCEYVGSDTTLRGKCIRTERFKYNYWGPERKAELYDLQEDPDETCNRIDDPNLEKELHKLQQMLIDKLSASENFYRPIHNLLKEGGLAATEGHKD